MRDHILRALVVLAGLGVVAAATHANVIHVGGYTSQDAPLIIAIAGLLSIGMAFVGWLWGDARRVQAVVLSVCILSGEAYWVLLNAEREIANRDARAAPIAQARTVHAAAFKRLDDAMVAKKTADAAAISEAAKMGCRTNCAKLLLDAKEKAAAELTAAREALAGLPEPRSATPLPDQLGIAAWAWDLLLAGLRSLAVVAGSLGIGMALHPRRRDRASPSAHSGDIQIIGRPINKREHVSHFLRATLRPNPSGGASLKDLHSRYVTWCDQTPVHALPPAELGKELRAVFEALGLECKKKGRDVIVYGAEISGAS